MLYYLLWVLINRAMAAINNLGNKTISIGNLSELAGVISNFPPEQLQNLQLDSSLYEALSSSIESSAVQVQEFQSREVLQNQILTAVPNTIPSQNEGTIIVNQPIVNDGIIPIVSPAVLLDSQKNIQTIGLTTTIADKDVGSLSTAAIISPMKANVGSVIQQANMVPPSNVLIQQQPPTPMLTINNANVAQVIPNQTILMQSVNETPIHGILPGQSTSMIVTPTLMSQVQPTATIQTINISDTQILQNATAVTNTLNPTESLIFTQPLQSTTPAALTVDQGQLIQLPVVTTKNIIPSSIAIDSNLLKASNIPSTVTVDQNILKANNLIPSTITIDQNSLKTNLESASNMTSNVCTMPPVLSDVSFHAATNPNQCILVDGQILSSNTIVGTVITCEGNIPVQQVLVSDIINPNPTIVLNGIQQNLAHIQPVPAGNITTNLVGMDSTIKTIPSIKVNTQPTQVTKKQPFIKSATAIQPPKNTKTVQTFSNFSPQSSIFHAPKTNKQYTTISTSAGTISKTSSGSVTNRNVVVKRTINVIKKPESQIIPMKPTSVEQVQPGVFKLQLTKVDEREAASLMKNTTVTASKVQLSSNYSITIPSVVSKASFSQTGSSAISSTVAQVCKTSLTEIVKISKASHSQPVPTLNISALNSSNASFSEGKETQNTSISQQSPEHSSESCKIVISDNGKTVQNALKNSKSNVSTCENQSIQAEKIDKSSNSSIASCTSRAVPSGDEIVSKITDVSSKQPLNTPPTLIHASKVKVSPLKMTSSATNTTSEVQRKKSTQSVVKSASKDKTVKTITVPKEILAKLKVQASGNVVKITDSALIEQLLSISSQTKKKEKNFAGATASHQQQKQNQHRPQHTEQLQQQQQTKTLKQDVRNTASSTFTQQKHGLQNQNFDKTFHQQSQSSPKSITKTNVASMTKSVVPSIKISSLFNKTKKLTSQASSTSPLDNNSLTSKFQTKFTNFPPKCSTTSLHNQSKSIVRNLNSLSSLLKLKNQQTHPTLLTQQQKKRPDTPDRIFIPAPSTRALNLFKESVIVANSKSVGSQVNSIIYAEEMTRRLEELSEEELTLESDLECKEIGFMSPDAILHTETSSHGTQNINMKKCKSPKLMLKKEKIPKEALLISGSETTDDNEEVKNLRQAIKSSHVGDKEKQMRNLARQEIENQLKRFSQQNSDNPSDTNSKIHNTKSKNTTSTFDSPAPKRKKSNSTSSKGTFQPTNENNNSNTPPNDTKEKAKKQHLSLRQKRLNRKRLRRKDPNIIEESRKRGRPKKFDDFVLPTKTKKGKKARKFFFPKEKKDGDSEDIETAENETEDAKISEIELKKNTLTSMTITSSSTTKTINVTTNNPKSPVKSTLLPKEISTIISTITKTESQKSPVKTKKSKKKPTAKSKLGKMGETKPQKSTKKGKKRKKKQQIAFEPDVLPEHLKTKPKAKNAEDAVIDLGKVKLKSAFAESSFVLDDKINSKTYKLLNHKMWICTLCGKPGNLGNLDVLFGPYKIKVNNDNATPNKTNKNSKNQTALPQQMNVWLHRDCAIWTSNICLTNQSLSGLGDSLDEAAITKCCLCSQVGATLQCSSKQCRDGYHFVCAKQRGCSFQMENFTITCPKHK